MAGGTKRSSASLPEEPVGFQPSLPTGSSRSASSDLVHYPFPLRTDVMAYFSLPRDLRRSEAQRIATFVASLAMDVVTDSADSEMEGP